MMMNTITDDIRAWLNTAKRLQQQGVLKSCVEINKMADALTTFLQQLLVAMNSLVKVEQVMTRMVDIGQLLGRLCSFPAFLAISKCYKSLLSCLLFFCVERPDTSLERKAKQWALTLIRSTLCYDRDEEIAATLDCTGFTQQHVSERCLKQVCSSLQQPAALDDFCTDTLSDVAAVCMTSRCDVFVPLLGRVLDAWPDVDTDIMKSLDLHRANTEMSYSVESVLWLRNLPSLEERVLSILAASRQTLSTAELRKLLNFTNLPRACAEHVTIYEAVYAMLKALYAETNGADSIARMFACLHECVVAIRQNSPDVCCCTSFSVAFPPPLRSLIAVLEVPVRGLEKTACEYYTQCLSCLLCELRWPDLGELHYLLLAFPHWYHVALILSLTSNKLPVEKCLVVIEAYTRSTCVESHSTSGDQIFHRLNHAHSNQVSLAETMLSLRRLLGKLSLTSDDLQCALSSSTSAEHKPVCVEHLVIWFLFLSASGHLISDTVLQSETRSQCVCSHLYHLLPICELFSDGPLTRLCATTALSAQSSAIYSSLLTRDSCCQGAGDGREREYCLCYNEDVGRWRQWAIQVSSGLTHHSQQQT